MICFTNGWHRFDRIDEPLPAHGEGRGCTGNGIRAKGGAAMKRVVCDCLILIGWLGLIGVPFTFGGSLSIALVSFLFAHMMEQTSVEGRPV